MNESMKVTFNKPYAFEGETYEGVDLSGVEDMTTEQLCQCDRMFERGGGVSAMKELNVEYACIIAAQVAKLPIEFFKGLPAREGNKVKTTIGSYFFGEE